MNAEFRENAAWRTFGLLSPDVQEAFDNASATDPALAGARDKMDAFAAAVSVIHSRPVTPRAEALAEIEKRCGLVRRRRTGMISRERLRSILQWAGWGVAAMLVVQLAVREKSGTLTVGQTPLPAVAGLPDNARNPGNLVATRVPVTDKSLTRTPEPDMSLRPQVQATGAARRGAVATTAITPATMHEEMLVQAPVEAPSDRGEKRSLIQEIQTLRAELKRSRQQHEEMLSPAAGRSWPLIVEMKPPGVSRKDSDPPLSSQIADALAGKATVPDPAPAEGSPQAAVVSAVPVYDPARDTGTLAVRNLPSAPEGSQYRLWVRTADATEAVFVGSLPENLLRTDSLDFSLGSTGIVPTSYYLTLDGASSSSTMEGTTVLFNRPVQPNSANIVLQGP